MTLPDVRLFEHDHGLICEECRRVIGRGQPYASQLTGMLEGGDPVFRLVCVYCFFPDLDAAGEPS